MYTVNSINISASREDNKIEGLCDSHKNGRKNVVAIAMGANFTSPPIVPSNSTPNEKFELAEPEPDCC